LISIVVVAVVVVVVYIFPLVEQVVVVTDVVQ
jgi:hypothetical protein